MGMTPYTSMTNQQTREEVEKGEDFRSVRVHVTFRRIPAVIVIDFDTDTFSESHVYQKARLLLSDHLSPCYASL